MGSCLTNKDHSNIYIQKNNRFNYYNKNKTNTIFPLFHGSVYP